MSKRKAQIEVINSEDEREALQLEDEQAAAAANDNDTEPDSEQPDDLPFCDNDPSNSPGPVFKNYFIDGSNQWVNEDELAQREAVLTDSSSNSSDSDSDSDSNALLIDKYKQGKKRKIADSDADTEQKYNSPKSTPKSKSKPKSPTKPKPKPKIQTKPMSNPTPAPAAAADQEEDEEEMERRSRLPQTTQCNGISYPRANLMGNPLEAAAGGVPAVQQEFHPVQFYDYDFSTMLEGSVVDPNFCFLCEFSQSRAESEQDTRFLKLIRFMTENYYKMDPKKFTRTAQAYYNYYLRPFMPATMRDKVWTCKMILLHVEKHEATPQIMLEDNLRTLRNVKRVLRDNGLVVQSQVNGQVSIDKKQLDMYLKVMSHEERLIAKVEALRIKTLL